MEKRRWKRGDGKEVTEKRRRKSGKEVTEKRRWERGDGKEEMEKELTEKR